VLEDIGFGARGVQEQLGAGVIVQDLFYVSINRINLW
jgi:hypothetical protein